MSCVFLLLDKGLDCCLFICCVFVVVKLVSSVIWPLLPPPPPINIYIKIKQKKRSNLGIVFLRLCCAFCLNSLFSHKVHAHTRFSLCCAGNDETNSCGFDVCLPQVALFKQLIQSQGAYILAFLSVVLVMTNQVPADLMYACHKSCWLHGMPF